MPRYSCRKFFGTGQFEIMAFVLNVIKLWLEQLHLFPCIAFACPRAISLVFRSLPNFALRWYVQYKLLISPGLELARSLHRVATRSLAETLSPGAAAAGTGDDKVD